MIKYAAYRTAMKMRLLQKQLRRGSHLYITSNYQYALTSCHSLILYEKNNILYV